MIHGQREADDVWWVPGRLCESVGGVSAMISIMQREQIKDIRGWCNYLLRRRTKPSPLRDEGGKAEGLKEGRDGM